jgi:hypothetical protein
MITLSLKQRNGHIHGLHFYSSNYTYKFKIFVPAYFLKKEKKTSTTTTTAKWEEV